MKSNIKRSLPALAILALLLSSAAAARPFEEGLPETEREALERARLEQELILAERTAVMLGALHELEVGP